MDKTPVEKVKGFIKDNLFIFIVVIISVAYIARSFISIEETGKTPLEILADGAFAFIFGFVISKMLSAQGMATAEKTERVLKTISLHSQKVEEITPNIDILDFFCEKMNDETLKREQTRILAAEGLRYEDFLIERYKIRVEEGYKTFGFEELEKRKKLAVIKARRLKLTRLVAGDLTTDGGRANDPYFFGLTKKQFAARRDGKQIFSKTLFAILFGYFGVKLVADASLANVIWTALQIAVYIGTGMLAYIQSYVFITDEHRSRIIKKIDMLDKFKAWLPANKKLVETEKRKIEAHAEEEKYL